VVGGLPDCYIFKNRWLMEAYLQFCLVIGSVVYIFGIIVKIGSESYDNIETMSIANSWRIIIWPIIFLFNFLFMIISLLNILVAFMCLLVGIQYRKTRFYMYLSNL